MRKCRRMKLKRGWGRMLRCGLFQSPIPLRRQICWGGTHESPTQRKLRRMRKVPSEGRLETDSTKATPSVHQAHSSRACLLTIASLTSMLTALVTHSLKTAKQQHSPHISCHSATLADSLIVLGFRTFTPLILLVVTGAGVWRAN